MSGPPSTEAEPRNPLYMLLLLAGLVFSINAVAYALLPVLEQKAADAGQIPPPSALRDALREHGGTWLLWELALVIALGLASMGYDRLRSLKKERNAAIIPPNRTEPPSPSTAPET